MQLSDIIQKNILVDGKTRGVCLGVGVSLKTRTLKYLLCAENNQQPPAFALNFSAVTKIDEAIHIPRLRATLSKNCARIFIGLPIYSQEGGFLGTLSDGELHGNKLSFITTNRNEIFSFVAVTACNDAILLRKLPYPLGVKIPTPLAQEKSDYLVTKPVLRAEIANSSLVKFTLSLPPFQLFERD